MPQAGIRVSHCRVGIFIFVRLINPGDFGSLDAETGHKPFLIESESVDTAMQGLAANGPRHAFVHDYQGGARAERPSLRLVDPIDCLLVHEEKRVAVFLNAGLQTIGSRRGPVAAGRFPTDEENSVAALRADDEASLHDIRKDKHRQGVLRDFARGGVLRDQLAKSRAGVAC